MPHLTTQVLVVGGGATGLGIAWDACLRGLSTVVVEQGDLAQGTSGRYHGLLHSGARYVLSDPDSARECAAENAILRRLAPHTIEDTGGLFIHTHLDPPEFADEWLAACAQNHVPVHECLPTEARAEEPLLTPHIHRAFRVRDAALDSFDLLHALAAAITASAGEVLLRHRLERLTARPNGFLAVISAQSPDVIHIEADTVVNAAGPFAGQVAEIAGVRIPLALGKGTMVAMANRLVHTVINRCQPPSDGDIIVPVGTVSILGTTDTPVASPEDVRVEPWEVDLLIEEASVLIPSIEEHRALRAWAGVRPLYRPSSAGQSETRELPRAHAIVDHGANGGPPGFYTIIGGKLTTFRRMAEDTVDLVCRHLNVQSPSRTAHTPLLPSPSRFHRLPERLEELSRSSDAGGSGVVCECELVTEADLLAALDKSPTLDLDDLRRDLRLGMGPCQAGFCGLRAAALLARRTTAAEGLPALRAFLDERWRGTRSLAWGHGLRQLELTRRIYHGLMAVDGAPESIA